jgi:hypothetical protein
MPANKTAETIAAYRRDRKIKSSKNPLLAFAVFSLVFECHNS